MSLESFVLPSFAKINLILRILGRRADKFHELCTVFQTVSLKDKLTFGENTENDRIILTCSDDKIPLGDKNLIVKAANLLREKFKVAKGASIYLEKNIPAPGGLGGGSSNAAVALIGLSKLWQINTSFSELTEIGSRLGSDVPFFFCGGTAIGTGRGDKITEIKEIKPESILIVTPDISVPTAKAFELVKAPDLTNNRPKSILQICCDEANSLDLSQTTLVNDFENSIFNIEPEIKAVKQKLLSLGAKQALLSGSGASVFAVFDNRKILEKAFDILKSERGLRVFSVKTVSRLEYQNSFDFR